MTDKLNDADKQRIEQEAKLYAKNHSAAPDKETPDWIITDFRKGAEYATIYEREQHSGRHTDNYLKLHKDYMKLKKQVSQLEAERSELRNKVIEEIADKFKSMPGLNLDLDDVVQYLNSLKTK